ACHGRLGVGAGAGAGIFIRRGAPGHRSDRLQREYSGSGRRTQAHAGLERYRSGKALVRCAASGVLGLAIAALFASVRNAVSTAMTFATTPATLASAML